MRKRGPGWALAYTDGLWGIEREDAEATKWTLKGALQRDLLALSGMPRLYGEGIGVPKDNVRAYMWAEILRDATPELRRKEG
jgi:TPR repeat protein